LIKKPSDEALYDLIFDKALIEASFAKQYGIRLSKEDISFGEFCRLLSGLMADTPLGQTVTIRAEKNADRLKTFTNHERQVQKAWRDFKAKQAKPSPSWQNDIKSLQNSLERVFGAAHL